MLLPAQPVSKGQSLTIILCGMVVAFAGLAGLVFQDGSMDQFLGAALLMVGNWIVLPRLIIATAARESRNYRSAA